MSTRTALSMIVALTLVAFGADAATTVVNFDTIKTGTLPSGWTAGVTGARGSRSGW